jgi:fibronectin-binding autotransporter adhesin
MFISHANKVLFKKRRVLPLAVFLVLLFSAKTYAACTGTAISGGANQTIPAATTYYVASATTQSGNVSMGAASSVFCIDGTYSGATVSFASGAGTINNQGSINNAGTNWPVPNNGVGGTINNNTGATMAINIWSMGGGVYTLNNYGTLNVTTDISGNGGTLNINNYGTITVTGTINYSGATMHIRNYSGGTINVNGAGGINISGGDFINDGTLSVANSVSIGASAGFSSSGTVTVGGNMTLNGANGSISGILNVTGGLTVNGATWNFSAKVTVGGNVAINGSPTVLSYTWTVTGEFYNHCPNLTLGTQYHVTSGSWRNDGTINGPASGCGKFNVSGSTTNSGTFAANSGNVDVCDAGNPALIGSPASHMDANSGSVGSMVNCSCTILPISLLGFTAEGEELKVHLKWMTATETNNDYFTVERSFDGINFEPINTVKGAGNSTRLLSYSYFDNLPLVGINYYRLKQTDFDGKYSYSPIAATGKNENNFAAIFPNPTSGTFSVQLNLQTENEVLIVMQDILGREVYASKVNVDPSGSSIVTITPNEDIPSGIYYVIASSNDKISKHKLMISK